MPSGGSLLSATSWTGAAATYSVDFTCSPRSTRGSGAVWSHLRAARKCLFDRISEEQLLLHSSGSDGSDGSGVEGRHDRDLGWDWALLLPLTDMAWRAATPAPHRALYLHEPSTPGAVAGDAVRPRHVAAREAAIAAIVARPASGRLVPVIAVIGDASFGRLSAADATEPGAPAADATAAASGSVAPAARPSIDTARVAYDVGFALTRAGYRVLTGGLQGVMGAASSGAAAAVRRAFSAAADRSTAAAGRPVSAAQAAALAEHGVQMVTCGGARLHEPIGLLPGTSTMAAHASLGLALPTGMGHARNNIVGTAANAVVIIGGGAGTMQEAAVAWGQRRMLIAVRGSGGTADSIAGRKLDARRRLHASAAALAGRADAWAEDCIFPAADADDVVQLLEERLHWYGAEAVHPPASAAAFASADGSW